MRVSRGIRPISRQGLRLGPVPLPQLKNPNNHAGQVRGDTATAVARRGEVVGFRWSGADLDAGYLSVERPILQIGGTVTEASRRAGQASGRSGSTPHGGAAT